jgi:hypothetical protein
MVSYERRRGDREDPSGGRLARKSRRENQLWQIKRSAVANAAHSLDKNPNRKK